VTRRATWKAAAAAAAALLVCGPLAAAQPRIWLSDSPADFSAGEARGVAVTVSGTLVLAAEAARIEEVSEATLFSVARDPRGGAVVLGTGDAGKVLRVQPDGKVETLAVLPEKEVTAVAIGADGVLYAAGAPGGKIYRLEAGKPVVHYETKAQYVWALASSATTLWAGTGLPGEIHRVTGPGKGERVHAAADAHVRTLALDKEGRVWAGTAGSGLVLRIEPGGRVATVYDSSKSEISSIAASPEGFVWASAISSEAPPAADQPISAPQSVPNRRTGETRTAAQDEQPGGERKPEVTVTVSGPRLAPQRPGGRSGGFSSELLLFDRDEPARAVWTSSEEMVFDVLAESGSAVVGTGPNGKVYRVSPETWALERTLDEKQVTLVAAGGLGTNGASGWYRLREGPRRGEFVSAVKDTGRTSVYGAYRVEADVPAGGAVEASFRSGESAVPDTTWSGWSNWSGVSSDGGKIDAPAGRYLQWKLRLAGGPAGSPVVRRVEAAYLNRNAAPVIESLIALEPTEVYARSAGGGSNVFESSAPDEKGIFTSLDEARSEGAPRKLNRLGYRTLTWKGTDSDGDTLSYDLEFRPVAATKWLPLRKEIRESFYSFDSTSLPDGDYVFRLTATDKASNTSDARTFSRESTPVRIDNTPPAIRRVSAAASRVSFEVSDARSPIAEVEYSIDAKEWKRAEAKDGLSDSLRETYEISLDGATAGSLVLVRASDAARNTAASSLLPN
jgi:streptogramin lyase